MTDADRRAWRSIVASREGWPLPSRVWLEGRGPTRRLAWEFESNALRAGPRAVPERACLEDFMSLADDDDEQIVLFALRWGVLGECWHGPTETPHHLPPSAMDLVGIGRPRHGSIPPPPDYRLGDRSGLRLTDQWRRLARRLAAAIRLDYEVDRRRPGEAEDWAILWGAEWAADFLKSPSDRRFLIDGILRIWQERLHLAVTLQRAGAVAHPQGLDGGLIALTAKAMRDGLTALRCSACGRVYLRKRPPRTGQENFCPADGQRAAWRRAQSRRRKAMTPKERADQRRRDAERKRRARAKKGARR